MTVALAVQHMLLQQTQKKYQQARLLHGVFSPAVQLISVVNALRLMTEFVVLLHGSCGVLEHNFFYCKFHC
jgi:hypothetical protein